MEIFHQFLNSLRRKQSNDSLLEAIHEGYSTIFEGVSINKDYLLKLAKNDVEKLKNIKKNANQYLIKNGFQNLLPDKENDPMFIGTSNFLTKLVLQGESLPIRTPDFFHDLIVDKQIERFRAIIKNSDMTSDGLLEEIVKYNKQKEERISPKEQEEFDKVEVVQEFPDGWKWVIPLTPEGDRKGACSIEGKVNKHCGNVPSVHDGDVLYSLRNGNKIGATVIVNGEGYIRESKGKANTKIALENHKEHMIWLFKHENIKGIADKGSYAPGRNLHVSDFLGVDEEVVKHFEEFKPEMISPEYDKIVLDLKRELLNGEITEQSVIDEFKQGAIELFHLKGILGKVPFSEKEIESLVRAGKLEFIDILQTDTKLFTPSIQYALVVYESDNYEKFIQLEKEVESFKMDHSIYKFIIEHGDYNYYAVPQEVREKYPELAIIAVNRHYSNYEYVPDSIKEKMPELLEIVAKRDLNALMNAPESLLPRVVEIIGDKIKDEPLRYQFLGGKIKEKLPIELTMYVIKRNPDMYTDIPYSQKLMIPLELMKYLIEKYPRNYINTPDSIKEQHPELKELVKELTK